MANHDMERLVLPALRGRIGDWVYYATLLKLSDVAERISLADEIHMSKTLNDLIQREVSNRATAITDYLLRQPQRFFNSLVVAVYGGDPKWGELAIESADRFDPDLDLEEIDGILGVLVLGGTERLFAIDGQHRVVGIREAVKRNPSLGDEEVSVIFVADRREGDGLQRTRRLFSTINRYAKPVNKLEIIALDEDDVLAIATRRLVDEHPLLANRVSSSKGKAMSATDSRNVTTVVAVYDVAAVFLRSELKNQKITKNTRPDEETVERIYIQLKELWDRLTENFKAFDDVANSPPNNGVVGQFRSRYGGNLLFRPVGLMMIVRVIRMLMDQGLSLEQATMRTAKAPLDLDRAPWVGLLWNGASRRMLTSAENQDVATKMLFFGLGGDLTTLGLTVEDLQRDLAGVLNRDSTEIVLNDFLS